MSLLNLEVLMYASFPSAPVPPVGAFDEGADVGADAVVDGRDGGVGVCADIASAKTLVIAKAKISFFIVR